MGQPYRGQVLTLAMNKPVDRTRYQVVLKPTVALRRKADELLAKKLPIGTMNHFFLEGRYYMARDEVHQHPPSDPVPPSLKEPHHGITIYFDQKPVIPPSLGTAAKKAFNMAMAPNTAQKNWADVFKFINGLSMNDMLAVFDSMGPSDLKTLARNIDYFGQNYNPKRMRFALDVILRRSIPGQIPQDVKVHGQDKEAQAYLHQHVGMPSTIEF